MIDRFKVFSSFIFSLGLNLQSIITVFPKKYGAVAVVASISFWSLSIYGQQTSPDDSSVIVQPGAPGQSSRILPSTTKAMLPPRSRKDVEFMQGMIMHHAQAVEMTAFIESRTENKEIRLLGARISQSQSDEMSFMRRWLENRGEVISPSMPEMNMSDTNASSHQNHHMMMPGMLTPKQMTALKNAKGREFDQLFLKGMIQHHQGALVMVKELFGTTGAGQDAEIFNFATDVDSGQRAEIKRMETLLGGKK